MVRSQLEAKLDAALKILYPAENILEDVPIKIDKRTTLYVDRVVAGSRIALEVDGRQHDKFSQFHHGDADGFRGSQARDAAKEAWLKGHGYTVVRIKHNEPLTVAHIRKRILDALKA